MAGVARPLTTFLSDMGIAVGIAEGMAVCKAGAWLFSPSFTIYIVFASLRLEDLDF